ncbi:MAG: hypothetical protein QG588_291 [Candidatus Poribacteria bacterium]|nr:hypothetical protein [Candidatus Poribacteria bacterium]
MKAKEICELFEEIAPIEIGLQSDRDRRVLGFRFGNPEINVTGVGVAWFMAMEVIEQASKSNQNLLLIHEPGLFYDNSSPWHTCLLQETNPVNLRRKQLLIDNDICVYTAHSNWDLQRNIGMQPTFAKALGFTDEIKRDIAVGVYRVETYIDLLYVVKNGTPDSIEKAVLDAIEIGKHDGGFILGSSDSFRDGIPVENVCAYFDAARRYG